MTDDERNAIFTAVGKLMNEFNMIENSLMLIFSRLIGLTNVGSDAFVAGELMYTTNSFDGRLEMIETLFELRLPDENDHRRKRWREIKKRLQVVKKARNACAHGVVGVDNTRVGIPAVLANPHSRQFNKPEGSMSLADLELAFKDTNKVRIELVHFSTDFWIEGWLPKTNEGTRLP